MDYLIETGTGQKKTHQKKKEEKKDILIPGTDNTFTEVLKEYKSIYQSDYNARAF